MMEDIPDYDKSKYVVYPLWRDEDGIPVYMTIPVDETSRALKVAFHEVLNGMDERSALDIATRTLGAGFNDLPGTAPWLSIPANWGQYVGGGQPMDWFYGRPIVSDQAQLARQSRDSRGHIPALKQMVRWTSKQFGVFSDLLAGFEGAYGMATGDSGAKGVILPKGLERALGYGALIKRSDRGKLDAELRSIEMEDADKAFFKAYYVPPVANDMVRERYFLQKRKDSLSGEERAQLQRLNNFYSKKYLPLREKGLKAMEGGDDYAIRRQMELLEQEAERERARTDRWRP
jgi:hypothetical protein